MFCLTFSVSIKLGKKNKNKKAATCPSLEGVSSCGSNAISLCVPSGFGETAGYGISTGPVFPSGVLITLTEGGSGAGDGEARARARCELGPLQCSAANTALLGLGSGPGWLLLFIAQSYPTFQPLGLQHARLPCPSPSPGVCSPRGPAC